MKISTQIILDTKNVKKDKTFPIKLRVVYQRQPRYYMVQDANKQSLSVTKEDFEKIMGMRPKNEHKRLREIIANFENKAIAVIESLTPFDFTTFKERLYGQPVKSTKKNLQTFWKDIVQSEREKKSVRNANNYECALTSFLSFHPKMDFQHVTVTFLNEYEKWMINKGKSLTTVSMYTRALRAVINQAIEDKIFTGIYPFGKKKYHIPAGQNIKKAINLDSISKIFDYVPENEAESYAKDFFLFSYLCNGINMKDIASLKFKDIDEDTIIFRREKTKNTRRTGKPIVAHLTEPAKEILERRKNPHEYPDGYVFAIWEHQYTEEYKITRLNQVIKNINKYTKRIGKKLGIDKEITTYTARHSFSTILKRSGVNIAYISESLGHTSLKTTENYLDSFEDDTRKEIAKLLLPKKQSEQK